MSPNDRAAKIAELIAKKKKFWRLDPPLALAEVEGIEARYGFTLPEEYKLFITQVGNGGKIPPITNGCKRLFPLQDISTLKGAGLEFPLSESWEWETDPDFNIDTPEGKEKYSAISEHGILVLMHDSGQGGQTWFLIVSGPRRGEVWERDDGGVLRLPECDFLDWIELCLNRKLKSYVNQLFFEEKEKQKREKFRNPLETIRTLMSKKMNRDIQWNPPVTISEAETFERKHGITLPGDYKTFITEIADGCTKFIAPNSRGKGGTFYSLKELDGLANLNKPFYFTENSKELRKTLSNFWGPYGRNNPIWNSLFASVPRESSLHAVWCSPDYSVLHGVLPFAVYNDTTYLNTQACLILNGPMKGEIWLARLNMLIPDEDGGSFFTWMIEMLEDGAR